MTKRVHARSENQATGMRAAMPHWRRKLIGWASRDRARGNSLFCHPERTQRSRRISNYLSARPGPVV